MRTTSISERAAEAKPWPRISATLLPAEAFREIAALLHVGDQQIGVAEFVGDVPHRHFGPMKLPEWITGRSFVPLAMPNGRMSSACACTTALTSGRASKIAAWMKRSR